MPERPSLYPPDHAIEHAFAPGATGLQWEIRKDRPGNPALDECLEDERQPGRDTEKVQPRNLRGAMVSEAATSS